MQGFLLFVVILVLIVVLLRQRELSQRLRALEEERLGVAPVPPRAAYPAPPAPTQNPVASAQQAAPPVTAPYRPTYVPPPPPAVPAKPRDAVPVAAAPPRVMPAPPATFAEQKPTVSLEAKLGQNWLNKIGIVSVVLGIALGLSRVLPGLGPLGKSLFGLAIGLGILGLGLWLERREPYRVFAWSCIGGGWAVLFFLSFAVYHLAALRIVSSEAADLVLMLLVASGMVVHSLRYRSQTVTTIAFLLAFLTVGISDVTVFSLVAGALLAGALCFVVARERWYGLGLAGLVGVYLNHYLWLHRVLPNGGQIGQAFPEFVPSVVLLLAYWLTFRLVYVLRPPAEGAAQGNNQALAGLAAILNSAGLLSLLKYQASHPEWTAATLLALGLAELALAWTVRRGGKGYNANRFAFTVLTTIAAVMLLAAVPAKFAGVTWPLLWLGEAEAFFLVGMILPEKVFQRLGVLGTLLTGAMLALVGTVVTALHAGVTLQWRMTQLTVALVCAALVLWGNAEFCTRRWPKTADSGLDRAALGVGSYLAAGLATIALCVVLRAAPAWICVAWVALVLALGEVATWLRSREMATQADLICAGVVLRALVVNLFVDETWHGVSVRLLTLGFVAMALYARAARVRVASWILPAGVAAAAYSWLATATVALLVWDQVGGLWIAVVWGAVALILFEAGLQLRAAFLRHQAYALLLASFVRTLWVNLGHPASGERFDPAIYAVVPLIAAFAWVYERAQRSDEATATDKAAGTMAAWAGVFAAAALLHRELREAWVALGLAVLAVVLLGLATALKRTIFVWQALIVLLALSVEAVVFDLIFGPAATPDFWLSRAFSAGAPSVLLLAALPLGFYLRSAFRDAPESAWVKHPEQTLYFVPLGLLTLLIFVQLHGAVITIGWAVLGLAAFLFALAVRERSFRLSGLGLLLLGVVKVLLWDVWHAPLAERYVTLIVMGVVLLTVSFLYSRFRETLLRLL